MSTSIYWLQVKVTGPQNIPPKDIGRRTTVLAKTKIRVLFALAGWLVGTGGNYIE